MSQNKSLPIYEPVIALLRHADYRQPSDVPSALLPYPLNDNGLKQAATASDVLLQFAKENGLAFVDLIDASPQLRAWQTANIISRKLGSALGRSLSVVEYPALSERSVGALANLTTAEIETIMAEDPRFTAPPTGWKSSSNYRLPFQGAESLAEAGQRVAEHIELAWTDLVQQSNSGLKIVVGHGASIRHAAMHLGLLAPDKVGTVSMYHARPVFLTKSAETWKLIGGQWKPRQQNSAGDEFGIA